MNQPCDLRMQGLLRRHLFEIQPWCSSPVRTRNKYKIYSRFSQTYSVELTLLFVELLLDKFRLTKRTDGILSYPLLSHLLICVLDIALNVLFLDTICEWELLSQHANNKCCSTKTNHSGNHNKMSA